MSFFQDATNITVQGGTFIAAGMGSTINIGQGQGASNDAFKDLATAAAHAALHDSAARFSAPRCHRNTRAKYLDKLERWMLGHEEDFRDARLIWLHGSAGVGKSAIMQSIVERTAPRALVLGSFFFSRNDPSRNHSEALIPTLAYQLASAFPEAMAILDPFIRHHPLIFKSSIYTQAYELIVRPLLHLTETGVIWNSNSLRKVFVIDGLDECSDPQKQAFVIHVIASMLCDHRLPIGFLLASRPEVAIAAAFNREKRLENILASISLDSDADAESDIRQFIEDGFLDIVDTHPLRHHITLPWPDPLFISKLVWKSSGHFVYAATAMKFISSPDEVPSRALAVLQGLEPSRTGNPLAELDTLYVHILTSAKYSTEVLAILRHCYLTGFCNTVAAVCCVFDISPVDVELFLSDVHSLVFLSPNNHAEVIITPRHASLEDFLADERRAAGIYMNTETHHASLVARYFQLLDRGPTSVKSVVEGSAIRGLELDFIAAMATAISHSQDTILLRTLISSHSPRDIWSFCTESFAPDATILQAHVRWTVIRSVLLYLDAVRDSAASKDNNLFSDQFEMYIRLLLDNLNHYAQRKPQYLIIPALLFSSGPSEMALVDHLMRHFGRSFRIGGSYRYHFRYLSENSGGMVDSRYTDAIRRLPQSRLSWSSDLTIAVKLVLQQLLRLSGTLVPDLSGSNRHKSRWGNRRTSMKCSRTYLIGKLRKTSAKRQGCFLLLKAVILYLHKSDCTGEVADLARKLLPKAALWFPRSMRRARTEMDSYVIRWEESVDRLVEKTRSFSINDID